MNSFTEKDLLLAILAMDAYNQGHQQTIAHGKDLIGESTVLRRTNLVTEHGHCA